MPRSAHTSAMVSLSRSRRPRTSSGPGMTASASRHAAPVVRLRPPNQPAQPIVHGDTPSGRWGTKQDWTRHENPSCSWGGTGPGGGAEQSALLARFRREAGVGRCPYDGASLAGNGLRKYAPFLIHAGKALLILPVPWAFSPALSATFCRLLHPQCSRCQRVANTARMPGQGTAISVDVRTCPSAFVSDRDARNKVT